MERGQKRKVLSVREKENVLKKIWYGPNGFMGATKLYQAAKAKDTPVTQAFVSKWLRDQKTNQLTIQPKRIVDHLRFQSRGENDKHVLDLGFFRTKSNGFSGFLCIIDVYSRYGQAIPFKDKRAATILKLYQGALKKTKLGIPRQILSDSGSEFKGDFKRFMDKHNIDHDVEKPGYHRKTSIVDRFIFTIKQRVVRKMNFKKNDEWDVYLKEFVQGYNDEIHDTINTTPNAVMNDLAVPVHKEVVVKKKPLLNVGQKVKIKLLEQRGMMRNRATDREFWSKENYEIMKASYSDGNVRHYKVGKNNESFDQIFYHEEVLKV